MATNNRSAIIHALNPLIEEDIRKRGFEVTFDAYVMYKTHIHEIINEIDLTEPLLLYDDIIPDLKLIVLSKWRSKSEGLKLLEELCESPHFCYMLLEIAAKSTSTTNSVAKKRLKTIIKKMESKAKSLRQLPVNVATVNFDFVVDVHPATGRMDSHKITEHDHQGIEQYPSHLHYSKENASSLQSDLVCCSTQQPLDLSSSHTYTSATNPGDSVGSNCSYQHQSSSEAVDDGDQSSVGF